MAGLPHGAAWMSFDGRTLSAGADGGGLSFMVDSRCLEGPSVAEAEAWVFAPDDGQDAVPYDQPEVQGARRDALAWWYGMLGDALVCHTTLALDESLCAGAITVVRGQVPVRPSDDPFSRLYAPRCVPCDLFGVVDPPPGPVLERYAGAPWPGGSFGHG